MARPGFLPLLSKISAAIALLPVPEGNPNVASLFGYAENFNMGYLLNNRSVSPEFVGQFKNASHYEFMPQGFISMDYTGGLHQSITGWESYNRAKLGEASVMLGASILVLHFLLNVS